MNRKTTKQTLGTNMYGGLPHLGTTDALYHQNLLMDLSAQTFTPTSIIKLDASKCYDRIYPNLSNISLQHIDAHPHIATVYWQTTKEMIHHINTAYGILPPHYVATNDGLYSGVGQGNSASGISWIAVKTLILKVMKQQHIIGKRYTYTHKNISHESLVVGYIDDNNILSTHYNLSKHTIYKDIKNIFLSWKDCLETTGGQLNNSKTNIYAWKWTLTKKTKCKK